MMSVQSALLLITLKNRVIYIAYKQICCVPWIIFEAELTSSVLAHS